MRRKKCAAAYLLMVLFATVSVGMTACGTADSTTKKNSDNSKTEIAEKKVADDASGDLFSYTDLKQTEFCFCSGAGAWSTTLTIKDDGSFSGLYQDSDMGDIGEGYTGGTMYYCRFEGKFSELQKVDDLTYKTSIEKITYADEVGKKEIKDDILYVYTDAYGLEDAKDIYFYLTGTAVDTLNEDLLTWIGNELYDTSTGSEQEKLPFVVLYNENTKEGFYSYDAVQEILNEVSICETTDQTYRKQMETDEGMTQEQLNQTANDLYSSWDNCLNEVWDVVRLVKSDSEFAKIKEEQRAWIKEKEQEIDTAGAEYEGGSMQSMMESLKGADLTKERVYKLLDYVK